MSKDAIGEVLEVVVETGGEGVATLLHQRVNGGPQLRVRLSQVEALPQITHHRRAATKTRQLTAAR